MLKQAEAEVVPSSSLVKVRVEVLVKVEVEVGVCLSGSSRDKFTTFSGVGGWVGGWLGRWGGRMKNKANLSQS